MEEEQPAPQQQLRFHPHNIYLSLVLVSITALFLAFSASYLYSRVRSQAPPIALPPIFVLNTLVLLSSSWMLLRAQRGYKADDTKKYQQSLLITIVITLVFLGLQVIGWSQLLQREIVLNSTQTASYLYLISGLHFLHVIAGLPFLILFWFSAQRRMREPVSVLVYFSDPEKRLKLKLLTMYWHFLDALWIYLVLFFGINYLIQ